MEGTCNLAYFESLTQRPKSRQFAVHFLSLIPKYSPHTTNTYYCINFFIEPAINS